MERAQRDLTVEQVVMQNYFHFKKLSPRYVLEINFIMKGMWSKKGVVHKNNILLFRKSTVLIFKESHRRN